MAGKTTASKSQWIANAAHEVTLPSSTVVEIKLPDIAQLIEAGEIPQSLLDAAIGYATGTPVTDKPTAETIKRDREFRDHLVKVTVVEPKLDDADIPNVPAEDKDMIVEFAIRARDMDTLGHHLAGLHTSQDFRTFRQLDSV